MSMKNRGHFSCFCCCLIVVTTYMIASKQYFDVISSLTFFSPLFHRILSTSDSVLTLRTWKTATVRPFNKYYFRWWLLSLLPVVFIPSRYLTWSIRFNNKKQSYSEILNVTRYRVCIACVHAISNAKISKSVSNTSTNTATDTITFTQSPNSSFSLYSSPKLVRLCEMYFKWYAPRNHFETTGNCKATIKISICDENVKRNYGLSRPVLFRINSFSHLICFTNDFTINGRLRIRPTLLFNDRQMVITPYHT